MSRVVDQIPEPPVESSTVRLIRLALVWILAIGLVGTGVELLLLFHTEGFWQLLPIALMSLAVVVLGWHALSRNAASIRALQLVMVLCCVSGFIGMFLHYQGNVAWEMEREPGISGWHLFKMAMTGATPSLAPGTMLQLGLVGLAYTFRHPLLRGARGRE